MAVSFFSLVGLISVLNNNYKKIEVDLVLSTNCKLCENELKKSLYEDEYFKIYVKNKDWVKNFFQIESRQKITYLITSKKPIFKIKNNIYLDEDFEQFFMPQKLNLPILFIEKDDLNDEIMYQANVIKQRIFQLESLNYSNLSGWRIVTDKAIAKIGKSDINERVKLFNKITNNLKQSNSNVINLDLRYQQGYVLKI